MSTKSLWAAVLAALPLCAQFETSEVLGTVRDSSNSPAPKASVTLQNQDTGVEAKTATDEAGNYDFFNVRSGRYTVTVEHEDFRRPRPRTYRWT